MENTQNNKSTLNSLSKYTTERCFYLFVISCMISIPLGEFITELFNAPFLSQPLIISAYGIIGILLCSCKIVFNIISRNIHHMDIFFISLVIFAIISLVFSTDIENSLTGFDYDELPFHFLAYYCIMYSASQISSQQKRKNIIITFLFLALFESILGLFQTFGCKISEVMFGSTTYEVYGLTQNTNFYGGLSVLFVGVSSSIYIFLNVRKLEILTLLTSSLVFYSSLNSMARLAWVGDFSIICFLFISVAIKYRRDKITKLHYYKKIFFLIISYCIIIVISFLKSDLPMARINKSIDEILEGTSDDFGSNRGYIWRYCLQSVPNHWATGIGLDNLRMCFYENPSWHKGMYFQDKAHNEYIHILATQGIFSLINYLTLLFITAKKSISFIIHNSNDNAVKITWIFFAMFTGYVVQAFFNSSIINVAIYFWLVIGLLNTNNQQINS